VASRWLVVASINRSTSLSVRCSRVRSAAFGRRSGVRTVAAVFSAMTHYMRTMVPLRIIGIVANLFFIAYGYFYPSYVVLVLYLGILLINFYRLTEMRRLIEQVKRSTNTDQSMDWLKPFMTKRTYKKGRVLFRKGDRAHEMFYVVSGKFLVSEIGVMILAGHVFGELGMLAPDNRRTSSVECVETGIVLTITYDKVQQLYFQSPRFGFYLIRLTTGRLLQNLARLEARLGSRLIKRNLLIRLALFPSLPTTWKTENRWGSTASVIYEF
jgi:CRP-like cAMP-binding protein